MSSLQFPQNEIIFIFSRIIPYIKKHKFKAIFIYFIFLFYFSMPSFEIPFFQYYHFRITSLMEQRALEHNLVFFPEQSWVNIDEVSPNFLKCAVSMEDGKFFLHRGIDWKQVTTTFKANKRRRSVVRGASTITMQTVKNLFFTTKRNFLRKAKELLVTFRMEKELSKKTILQDYINAIEWGDGIFGIKEASELYFRKDPKDLTLYESARLASVIPSPLIHKPNTNSRYVIRRSLIILGRYDDVILFPQILK
jgi:monofunctional biosynthetic peptidoglycan transglycosylase